MALNFPDSPSNGDVFVDSVTGESWTYEASTNSWTSDGLTTAAGIVYKGGIDVTTTAPAGAKAGWLYVVSSDGVADASFTGISGKTFKQGNQIIYDGSSWDILTEATPDSSETVKGIVELATAAETTTGTDTTRAVHPAGLKVELDKKVSKAGDTMTGNLTVPSLNGSQLAGFRNVLINGNLTINQRGVDITAAATGKYGQDRWKKTAGGMTQIVEEGSFEPGATYTLSGTGVTTQQLTAPASGNWTLPDIPVTARKIQLEPGPVATPFEHRPIGTELALCQRYFEIAAGWNRNTYAAGTGTTGYAFPFLVEKRATPTLQLVAGTSGPANVGVQNHPGLPRTQGILVVPSATGDTQIYAQVTADAEL